MLCQIKDYTYTISEVEPYEFEVLPGQKVFGQTDIVKQTIKILRSADLERKIKSLIHELSHAFQDAYGFVNIEWTKETLSNFDEVCLIDRYRIADRYFWEVYGIDILDYMDDGEYYED